MQIQYNNEQEIDEATIKKIKDIIDHQFDLEIYLKQREVATIKQEITKAETILRDLKLAVEKGILIHCFSFETFMLNFLIFRICSSFLTRIGALHP